MTMSNGYAEEHEAAAPHTNNTPHEQQQQHPSKSQRFGIVAMELYYPLCYVNQSELEQFDGVPAGKYTVGLGQHNMGFSLCNEDIQSICMTALSNLLDKYQVTPGDIGFLEVGTETLIDKSKSVKSTLMSLFAPDESDVEGVDSLNACFGGTAALFHALNWLESSSWDGRRFACVVMGDIALYEKGNARPTGGCGALALLLGPNAPLVFESGKKAQHFAHNYDFYKPRLDSEYPVVDGQLSVQCYLRALDQCYARYKKKFAQVDNNNNTNNKQCSSKEFSLDGAQAFAFHSPYSKLVQKSFARLCWNDLMSELVVASTQAAATATTEETAKVLAHVDPVLLNKLKQVF